MNIIVYVLLLINWDDYTYALENMQALPTKMHSAYDATTSIQSFRDTFHNAF